MRGYSGEESMECWSLVDIAVLSYEEHKSVGFVIFVLEERDGFACEEIGHAPEHQFPIAKVGGDGGHQKDLFDLDAHPFCFLLLPLSAFRTPE